MRPIDADALQAKCERNHLNFVPIEFLKIAPTITASPWRKVEEPPKIGVPVLVTYIGYNTGEVRCDLLAAYDGITWRYWDDDMLDEVMVEITHWMPLPEPPGEDKL